MSRIDDLIAELCPDGVEFRRLGDVASVGVGARPNKQDLGGQFTFWNGGVESSGSARAGNTDADTITIPSRGSVGVVGYQAEAFWCGPLCYRVRAIPDTVLTRFLFFYLKSVQPSIIALQQTGSIPALNKKELVRIRVPVPPLQVQHEIVRVLDTFTALEAELEAELEARRRQYEYYRDSLLAFRREEEGVRWLRIGELGSWVSGITPSKTQSRYWENGTIPWVASMDVSATNGREIRGSVTPAALEETPLRLVSAPSVAVVMRSNVLRRFLPIGFVDVDATANQDLRLLTAAHGVDPRYVYQTLLASSEDLRRLCVRTDGSMAAVDSKAFFDQLVAVPPLEEQARIVNILDSFDALVNDLSVGLPAVLVARRKQYEYYRDKLLTFKELAA